MIMAITYLFIKRVLVSLSAEYQWCSRTFGRPGRWSNLPPFRLRFL